ncbi:MULTISPECIES: hypothetical protein [Paenibacillus]|uniref:YqzN/YkzM domain-containing protein n=1 Tax=Paenibacillus glycanilyticus TaxID=126569 RepID=A0ABQ6NHG5_9BACL|nr:MULTISPECIES: hypothetical protein [Paenibacillus]MCK9858843.1 hypothetical protein [Paenibacillus sp. ATY16]GMK44020.1 hypothetical protein PghCCS26_11470 [Paenibacillus glycanilyticus]
MPRPRKIEVQPPPAQVPADALESAPAAAGLETAETRYTAESLRRNARELFRVNPEVVDGALYGTSAHELTIAEAQALIKAYMQREVR